MARTYPALQITWPSEPDSDAIDYLIAAIDETSPVAVDDQPSGVRVFFASEADRDRAAAIVIDDVPAATVTSLLVPDDNWAERSQAALQPIRVGRIVVAPPWAVDDVLAAIADDNGAQPFHNSPPEADSPKPVADTLQPAASSPEPAPRDPKLAALSPQSAAGSPKLAARGPQPAADLVIAIQPSMGFGTGHHASTRLCLALLQRHVPQGGAVIDIGTGSGVLAIAAWRLGAASVLGIDVDRDALTAAAENVERNHAGGAVTLDVVDITRSDVVLERRFDLACANITGAMLQRHAARVLLTLTDTGVVIASGFQSHERDDVSAAFREAGAVLIDDEEEDGWVAAAFRRTSPITRQV